MQIDGLAAKEDDIWPVRLMKLERCIFRQYFIVLSNESSSANSMLAITTLSR